MKRKVEFWVDDRVYQLVWPLVHVCRAVLSVVVVTGIFLSFFFSKVFWGLRETLDMYRIGYIILTKGISIPFMVAPRKPEL